MISLAIVTISGEPGCSSEEVARLTAQRLQFELITESRLRTLIDQEFQDVSIPDRAYPQVAASLMAKLAVEYHLLINTIGAETYFRQLAGVLRIRVVAPESRRIGSLMVDRRLERPAARALLGELESGYKAQRKRNFGRGVLRSDEFDITYNSGVIDSDQIARMIQVASETLHLREHGLLSQAAEAQIQFQMRLNLSKHGIAPVSKVTLKHAIFSHPSEQIFANLLDFYRIAWDYEPKSFPISWDKDGSRWNFSRRIFICRSPICTLSSLQ